MNPTTGPHHCCSQAAPLSQARTPASDGAALAAWLREQRLARFWSIAEMGRQLQRAAKASGDHTTPAAAILATYVRRWEAAKIAPTERYRLHYCTALGLTASQFGQPVTTPPAAPPGTPASHSLNPGPASHQPPGLPTTHTNDTHPASHQPPGLPTTHTNDTGNVVVIIPEGCTQVIIHLPAPPPPAPPPPAPARAPALSMRA